MNFQVTLIAEYQETIEDVHSEEEAKQQVGLYFDIGDFSNVTWQVTKINP